MHASFLLLPNKLVSTPEQVFSPLPNIPIESAIMPCLRLRIRGRRGSSRGRLRRPSLPPRTTSSSSSYDDSHSSAPHGHRLCSGRCLGTSVPSRPPAQTHTARFSFLSSLNRPLITASITIAFLEELQNVDPISGLVSSSDLQAGSMHNINLNLQGLGSSAQQGQTKDISMPEGQASGM